MERVKLIWDFRGANAISIAEHHAKHLAEFAKIEKLEHCMSGVERLSESHHTAFLVVEKTWMNTLRERLKPHRGQLYNE